MDRFRSFTLVLEYLSDYKLMETLERERRNERNVYLILAVWNTILASLVFEHDSTESLRRELSQNSNM